MGQKWQKERDRSGREEWDRSGIEEWSSSGIGKWGRSDIPYSTLLTRHENNAALFNVHLINANFWSPVFPSHLINANFRKLALIK